MGLAHVALTVPKSDVQTGVTLPSFFLPGQSVQKKGHIAYYSWTEIISFRIVFQNWPDSPGNGREVPLILHAG